MWLIRASREQLQHLVHCQKLYPGCSHVSPRRVSVLTYAYAAQPYLNRSCQATDHNGCVPGDTTHINSLEVDVRPRILLPAAEAVL